MDSREINTELSNKCSMDLLQHFPAEIHRKDEFPSDEYEDIELNLGLSLGGCFGVDTCQNRLALSSSIGGTAILQRDSDAFSSSAASLSIGSLLMRASSLPTQADEERRKRREMQSLRRMEAKRKRTEKQRNSRAASGASLERSCEEHKRVEEGGLIAVSVVQNNRRTQGLSGGMDASPTSSQSLPEHTEQKPIVPPTRSTSMGRRYNPTKNLSMDNRSEMEMSRSVMEEMPCVSTVVEGPNGIRKIEGFLYKYREREELRIVCVCHGKFLSPAEFVKHAGGGDVAHPLRHILVNPSPPSSFF
ncbi:hypothetical protein AAC387_Pa02g1402 [Persea americana]